MLWQSPYDEAVRIRFRGELRRHRRALMDAGYDPDFIGVTEVEPVKCENAQCRAPLPWSRVRGFLHPARCTRCSKGIPYATLRKWQD
jgi:hypothetical protein